MGRDLAERIFKYSVVDEETGCWVWQKYKNKNGYGQTSICRNGEEKTLLAHRASYVAIVGPIPPGLELDHLCYNPSCVNPEHLEAVSRNENRRRQRSNGRQNHTDCPFGHGAQRFLRNGYRKCQTCCALASKRHRAKKKLTTTQPCTENSIGIS